ncbi:anti-sigma factor [Arthrobacter sp. RT-1]|uniref:anti-sigma factor n=1 Tax=Arthrobacter sp. RT-1 TaxID=2292263 RepID=UPI0015F18B8A|nr:anti-sigma factor [Arthrobacter sp. RT-1]
MRSPFPLGGRHQRTSSHLASCHECASAVRRERQYLERLRDAPIPPASDDLTARLLARTSELAAEPRPAAAHAARPRAAVRVLAMTAGGTVAAAGVLAVGAFAAAGDPLTGTDASAALSPVSSQTPADGRALSAEQVSMLRSEGWACPELEAMGFHLESAQAVVIDGQPAVHLRLSDGSHYATVTEQHPPAPDAGSRQDNLLQVLGSSPWSATYRTAGRTFTYESNLPAERADDALPILQRLASQAGEGVSAGTGESSSAPESLATRLQRGINNIVARFTQ